MHKPFSTKEREKIQEIVSAQGHEGIILCPKWLKEHNILLGFESRKMRGTQQICPVIKKLHAHLPAFAVADKKAAFIRTIIPNACLDPQYLSPEKIGVHGGDYPLSASSKQRVRIDPTTDDMGYSRRAIGVIKAWQNSAVEYLAANPHTHELVSPTTGKPASADEIRSIMRNKSDTSIRPIIDETACEDGEVGIFYAHNRIFKSRGQKKADVSMSSAPDPATVTVMEHKDFSSQPVLDAFNRVLEDTSYSLKVKPIVLLMPDGKTVSYGDKIYNGAIGSVRVSFGPLHVRNDGGKTQTTFTHYCDQIKLYSNGPDPEPSTGTNFMELFGTPAAAVTVSASVVVKPEIATPAGSPRGVVDSVLSTPAPDDTVNTQLDSGDDTVTEDVDEHNGPDTPRPGRRGVSEHAGSAPDDSSDGKRKRINKLSKKIKRVKKSAS